jgi:hypothetical protein
MASGRACSGAWHRGVHGGFIAAGRGRRGERPSGGECAAGTRCTGGGRMGTGVQGRGLVVER